MPSYVWALKSCKRGGHTKQTRSVLRRWPGQLPEHLLKSWGDLSDFPRGAPKPHGQLSSIFRACVLAGETTDAEQSRFDRLRQITRLTKRSPANAARAETLPTWPCNVPSSVWLLMSQILMLRSCEPCDRDGRGEADKGRAPVRDVAHVAFRNDGHTTPCHRSLAPRQKSES